MSIAHRTKLILVLAVTLNLVVQIRMTVSSTEKSNEDFDSNLSIERGHYDEEYETEMRKRDNTDWIKKIIESFLHYSNLLKEKSFSSYTKRKLATLSYNRLKKVLSSFINESPKNRILFTKALTQVLNSNKTNKNGKKLSASDDVNSITGFWG